MRQMRPVRWARGAAAAAGAVLALATTAGVMAVGACSPAPDSSRVTDILTTDNAFEQFAGNAQTGPGVEGFLEAKCASLDCHGQVGRPLRIFSQNGLRLVDDAGNTSGSGATTQAEIFANYTATIGLQPELISNVFAGTADPQSLLLVRKPRQLERHKGGAVIVAGDDSDNCLNSWLLAQFDPAACKRASAP